jgi:hypothetical protein
MTRPFGWAFVALLAIPAQSRSAAVQEAGAPAACAQIRQACQAEGYVVGGGRGKGLVRDCTDPILSGQTKAPDGRQLPSIDPAVVSACNKKTAAAPPDTGSANTGTNSDGLMMSEPVAVFTGTQLGLNAIPDQQTPVLRDPGGAYQLYLTGVRPGQPGGVVNVFSTSDLTQPQAYRNERMILSPPQRKHATGKCDAQDTDDCATYIGMTSVFENGSSRGLVGFYVADQQDFADGSCGKGAFYGQIGVATTQDGAIWRMHGPTLRGVKLPRACTRTTGPIAFNQPAMIKIGGDYYIYFALPASGKQGIGVARAPVQPDGTPGEWQVRDKGQWIAVQQQDKVPTLQDFDMVVSGQAYVTMPWISYNTYLETYLLTFVTQDGFYYAKLQKKGPGKPSQSDIDAQAWTAPQTFARVPGGKNWQKCQITWENLSFVSPEVPDNHTTGKAGYAILSVVPGWSCGQRAERSFSIASYAFGAASPPPPPTVGPAVSHSGQASRSGRRPRR